MTVRAKFKVFSKTPTFNTDKEIEGYMLHMGPVYDSNPTSENGIFYRYTPGGLVTLTTVSLTAAAMFDVGKEYYLDFTPA